ncbi:MAG: sugar kinase [Clostridiaceae bacterium]|nr:sugar kinase [Clostridiaceae bacterium]
MKTDFDISTDDIGLYKGKEGIFVTFGEVMIRDTPADLERLERTRQVYISLAGSEFTLAVGLSRLGIPSTFITRVPDNPYGWAVRNVGRESGVNTDHVVWTSPTDPIGRMLYELGRTPRRNVVYYQRKYSTASLFGKGMVNWGKILQKTKIFHTSGITFGLSTHSGYSENFCLEAFLDAVNHKPANCWVGLDLNYRESLWNKDQARSVLTQVIEDHIDILITTIEDMATLYNISCGKSSVEKIVNGNINQITDDDIRNFAEVIIKKFKLKILAITIRYPLNFENHLWESVVVDYEGNYFRSPSIHSICLVDRLGGGDTWNAGFYYGLLTSGFSFDGIQKGVLVGDAASRLQQTLMFDLPIIDRKEVGRLLQTDNSGGGKRVAR